MGRNGTNVDTLMLLHVDEVDGELRLLSIPRDLYYKDQKINSYYGREGLASQVAAVEDVAGLSIRHYALIDMELFRELVDLLGGVKLYLPEDLVDPSYSVCDAGACSTLYYPAGWHQLSGTEALRIARSRHSTSDYSRAERQQLLLGALKDRLKEVGIQDSPSLLSSLGLVLKRMNSDISLADAVGYFLKYRDYSMDSGHVLSTANVLDSIQVPVDYVTSLKTAEGGYAIYTLSPKDQNWDLVRWYVRDVFSQ